MALTLTVPREYGYVLLAAASTSVLNLWLGLYVGNYRKAARVPYPNAYATATEAAASKEKYLFNCAQRSHAQFLEQLPPFLVTLLVSGLKYPVLSAAPILYRSPLPSQADLPVYVLNAAALPDVNHVKYDALLPYVLARLPNDEDLIGGKGYELVFFAGEEERSASVPRKSRPGWAWTLRAYNVLSRLIRKRLQKLYLVHQRSWVKVTVEMFSTVVSPKVRKKIVHVSSLSGLALHIPIEDLLIPPSVYLCDRRIARDIYVPYVTGRRAFGVNRPLPTSATGAARLPRVLRESTSFVLMDDNVKTEGLFRINARAALVSILREAYDRGQKFIVWKEGGSVLTYSHWQEGHGSVMVEEHQYAEGFTLVTATGLIKLWYAELQEPIFPQASYPFLRRIVESSSESFQTSTIIDLMGEASDWSPLCKVSRQILTMHLLPFLNIIAAHQDWNKMAPYNLAVCFAPALIRGPDVLEDTNIISTISRILEHAVTYWDSKFASAFEMDLRKFNKSLRVPEAIEDREDPLDTTVSPTTPLHLQTDGIMLIDKDTSDDEGERPPLPPRTHNNREGEEERPSLPPRINMEQPSGEDSNVSCLMRRKPAPVLQSPPRYSTIFTRSPASAEDLPVYTMVANGRLRNSSNTETSLDNGLHNVSETAISRKPVSKLSDHN
ncbi:hypothetical protein MMC27_005778 [Xylographa pallens]|nr:hypothetical protein [Xylographa pallens]